MQNIDKLTSGRIKMAFAIALMADIIQIPVNLTALTGVLAVPAIGADEAIDAIVALLLTGVLGFHWILLPTAFIEAIPVVNDLPTWTACVGFLVWQRRSSETDLVHTDHHSKIDG
jgi:hypothetical protein